LAIGDWPLAIGHWLTAIGHQRLAINKLSFFLRQLMYRNIQKGLLCLAWLMATHCLLAQSALQVAWTQVMPPLCLSDTTGQIIVNIEGGTPPYQFNWLRVGVGSTIGTNSSIQGLSSGLYQLKVTDSAVPQQEMIQQFSLQAINDLAILQVVVTPSFSDEPTGTAKAIIFGGVLPYQFSWPTGNMIDDGSVKNLPAGPGNVQILDANGCRAEADYNIAQEAAILIATTKATICGCDATVCVTAPQAAQAPFKLYLDSQLLPALCNGHICAGQQDFKLVDALGQEFSRSTTVLGVDPIQVELEILPSGQADAPIGRVTISAIGGTQPYTYDWTGSKSTTSVAEGLAAGSQYVLLTDQNGCDTLIQFDILTSGSIGCLESNTILSPNGDGSNDVFILSCIGLAEIGRVEVQVFAQSGKLVFTSDDYRNDWSGTGTKGDILPTGAYFWIATSNPGEPDQKQTQGHLTLLIEP
jgi:trimeric autotransporter adhesin